jgi:hypothetical protein
LIRQGWFESAAGLQQIAAKTLFFVGGAPRSGTTWLQQMLDCHPDVSCKGEGLFWRNLALPLEALIRERRLALEAKNTVLFKHTGGYPLPDGDHVETLLGTAILLALQQQCAETPCRAVGEKTPENVFLFPRLKRLFPRAKLLVIARDPRDALASAWHMFYRKSPDEDETAAKLAFLHTALPPIVEGTRMMLGFEHQYPQDYMSVTYEALHTNQARELTRAFEFLGVSTDPGVVSDCMQRTGFAVLTGGRPAGEKDAASFHRRGLPGGWEETLNQEMNDMILRHLAWSFPKFGWRA